MSVHHAVPHLFRFGDLDDEPARSAAELRLEADLERERERDFDDDEMYGEEEGTRVLYQLAFFDDRD